MRKILKRWRERREATRIVRLKEAVRSLEWKLNAERERNAEWRRRHIAQSAALHRMERIAHQIHWDDQCGRTSLKNYLRKYPF